MINELKMCNVSSYKTETKLLTDKKNNLLYGLNGTGKSTLSGYFYNFNTHLNDEKYKNCSGLEQIDKKTTEILVYNQQFVHDNFYESKLQPGIFSLSKTNKDAQNKINIAKKVIEEKNSLKEEKINTINRITKDFENKQKKYFDAVWKTEQQYTGGDRILDPWFTGLKKEREKFFNYVADIPCPEKEPDITIENIKDQLLLLNNHESGLLEHLDKISYSLDTIENDEIFSTQIVGNKNSTISKFIDELNNADWIKHGLNFINTKSTICPFCHQETITPDFISELYKYFDASYQNDINLIARYLSQYEMISAQILENEIVFNNSIINPYSERYLKTFSQLKEILNKNIAFINNKNNMPSLSVELVKTSNIINNINLVITEMNLAIDEYNKKITQKEKTIESLKRQFWSIVRWNNNQVIELYRKEKKDTEDTIKQLEIQNDELDNQINSQKKIIITERKKVVNLDDAVENIKIGLIDIGITDFTIENHNDGLYKIKRDENDNDIFESLSEGEKMVISFLYFVELCKGSRNPDSTVTNKIVVIDDPISSLSHIFVFNIGRLIKNEFLSRKSKYEQVFILTHNLYFFYEIAENGKYLKDGEESIQKLFRLQKNINGTSICEMKYTEIQNDYQAYWAMIRNPDTPPALLANCMRNILDHFFGFIEKKALNEIFSKPELCDRKYQAFNRYINRESHSDSTNIFDMKEYDYETFKEAFHLVFKLTNYEEHYKKMMKA
ncbi:MAG: AAA family ATPase [Spirochaetia bacterium]|nr:AAA family ATPase [Spirochaetia bacterium]